MHFYGANDHLGATVGPIAVRVAPKVTVSVNRTTAPVGTTFKLSTSVSPTHAGQTVVLQRYYGGAWRKVAERSLSSTSAATFAIRPTRAGAHRYRIRKPADRDHVVSVSRAITCHVQG